MPRRCFGFSRLKRDCPVQDFSHCFLVFAEIASDSEAGKIQRVDKFRAFFAEIFKMRTLHDAKINFGLWTLPACRQAGTLDF